MNSLIPPIINEIHISLASLVNGRAHPNAFPDGMASWPAIRYQQIACEPINAMSHESNLDRTIWRVDVFDADYAGAITLARQVRDAMRLLSTPAACDGETELYDEEVRVYQRALDFEVWIYRPESALSAQT